MNMKKLFFLLCAFSLSGAAHGAGPEANIVPRPASVVPGEGTFTVTASTVIGTGRDAQLRRVADLFAETVEPALGGRMKSAAEGAVSLTTDNTLAAEAYVLEITPSGVTVRGGTAQGVFYGLQSLRQLVVNGCGVLPVVTVKDRPFFEHRGGMLDSGRYYWTPEQVKEFIDILALHKMNRFHWHLTEDQGWRIEIKKYPELTRIGSVRKETLVGHYANSTEYDGTPYGGFYTQKEIRDIVQYAADRFITVIPEIELPGHAVAALASYPWLGCRGEGYEVRTRWGVSPEVYCPGKETTFGFLQDVFTEVLALFPSEYIHIGGDEASKQGWRTCPKCAARMRKEGLKDVDELQSYMIRRIETFLNAKGRRLLGWDEILEGGLAPDATVMSWRGTEGGIAAAAAGHHAVMTPSNYCYLDFCQDDPTTEPVAAAAFLTLEQAYSYDPAPDSLGAQVVPMILGVQGNLWCEHVPTAEHAEHMMWPRLLAVAEVGWSAPERKDYDDFYARALDAVAWLQERGYHPFDQKNAVGPRPESLEPLRCLSTGKTVIYHTPYSPKYAAAGDGSLTDGLRGGWNYGDRRWLGWLDTDVDLVVDLGERQPVRRIAADFMQGFYADIWMPRAVEFSVSDDNEHFTPLATVGNDIPVEFKQDCYREFGWTGQTEARYVRLKARHNGRPGGWIFTDEIIVE